MNRRRFVSCSGGAAVVLAGGRESSPVSAATPQRALMQLGTETGISEERLKYLARFGVKNVCAGPKPQDGRLYLAVDELKRMRDAADKHGISVDLLNPPFLASNHVDTEKYAAIMLGKSPERDREIVAAADAAHLIDQLLGDEVPAVEKWVDRTQP